MRIKYLKEYARFLKTIRHFFDKRGLLEVTTPILSPYAISDAYIDSIQVRVNGGIDNKRIGYLHTSPEIAMKKLLIHGSGDIYQICPVFRDNEQGRLNRNEFAMLEWYRLDFDMQMLIDEVSALIQHILPQYVITHHSYQQLFQQYAGIDDIHNAPLSMLKKRAQYDGLDSDYDDKADAQMHLFVHCIEPQLQQMETVFVYDYPKEQAALATISAGVAKRFELFVNGVELANGYQELTDAKTYQARFSQQLDKRRRLGQPVVPIDDEFLNDLTLTLPASSGVALGLERLFMLQQGEDALL